MDQFVSASSVSASSVSAVSASAVSASAVGRLNVNGTEFKITGKDRNNTLYQCPTCDKVITCSGTTRLKCHIVGQSIGSNHCAACPRPKKESKAAIILEIHSEKSESAKKRKLLDGQQTINLAVDSDDIDQALLDFLVENNLAPLILESTSFESLVRKLRAAPIDYKIPPRRMFSIDSKAVRPLDFVGPKFGKVLQEGLEKCRIDKELLLQGVSLTGGALHSDGMKSRKRATLNSVLATPKGRFFVQVIFLIFIY